VLWHYPPSPQFLNFNNIHADIFVDLFALPEVQFLFEVSPTSRLYELDWKIHPEIELRVGRIWIPFDDMGPTRPYGGLISRSELAPSHIPTFLPDLWTDLGVAVRVILSQTETETSDVQLYLVNGFQDDGIDPFQQVASYPGFGPGSNSTTDNNNDKAIGARLRLILDRSISYGFSAYTGQYTGRNFESSRVSVFGIDSQVKLGDTWKVKGGYAVMLVGLISGSAYANYVRGGAHFSILKQVNDNFKVTLSGSAFQTDDRLVDASDRVLAGLTFSYLPQPNMELSGIFSRDFNKVLAKTQYNAIGLRYLMVF
jgi:hypothetical protein